MKFAGETFESEHYNIKQSNYLEIYKYENFNSFYVQDESDIEKVKIDSWKNISWA